MLSSAVFMALLLFLSSQAQTVIARIIFAILLIVSVFNFSCTLWRRLSPKTRRVSDLPFDNVPGRLWRVFTEVLLQYRVIRDRPIVGMLHALVMWGFLAFLWVSAEHLSLGFRGWDKASAEPGWYAAFAAAWAVAVFVGITGLAFRRFVLRPQALGKLSPASGVVAALIAGLMATYIFGWGFLPVGGRGWTVNWWLHTLCFLAILVVVPQSKHLHLMLGPLTVFFRSEKTSSLRPLRDDDDLGMLRFSDLTWKDVLQLNACVECGRCEDACPAHSVGKSLSPKEVVLAMQHGLAAGGAVIAGTAAEVSAGKAWVREPDLHECLTCGACEEACAVGMEHVGTKILDVRRGLVSEGRIEHAKIVGLFSSMERQPRNPWGMGRDTRQKFVAAEKFPIFDGSQEWLLWLGCCLSFDAHGRDVARSMSTVLNAAGVSWGVLEEEPCCGESARRLGNEYLFLQMSEDLIGALAGKNVRKLVTCCPHCATMLDVDYRYLPEYAKLGIEVRHHSELLSALLPRLALEPAAETVAYHDPCYLARARGITDAPREILSACGLSVREMPHSNVRTFCCGAGGAQIFIEDDHPGGYPPGQKQGRRVNHARFEEVAATGASTVTVACPYCPIMLRDAANHANRDGFAILDIAEVVANRLRKEGDAPCTQEHFAHTA